MNISTRKKTKSKGRLLKTHFAMCIMFSLVMYAHAQINVSGTVIDDENEPMIGVVVQVKNASLGTSTNVDGKYSIAVPEGSILEFSFMGYKTQSIAVQSKSVINVTMSEDTKLLEEVVVVGYSSIRKESLTGALQVVGKDKLLDATTPTVENLLTGKAPGVYVNSGSGQPGESGKIVIRGKSTLSGSTDPIWVVDGVIMGTSASDLNPADVETITILKDAASTAVYGSLGANGVVLVTTKKGEVGKMRISASAKFVATTLDKGRFDVMNGSELYDLYNSFDNKAALEQNSWWTPELRNKNYDWWKDAVETGFAQDYNVSLNGGTEKVRTYVSLGMYDESGAVKGYDFSRYSLLVKVEFKPLDWLTIRPQVNGSRRSIKDRQHSVSAMYGNLPWDSPYREDGTLVSMNPIPEWVNTTGSNYLYDLQWNNKKSERHEVAANFDFDAKITDWLTFASVNSYKFSKYESTDYVDPKSSGGKSAEGRITEVAFSFDRIYTNQLLRINKAFGDHYINAVVGYEWNEQRQKFTESMATGFPQGFNVQNVAAISEKTDSGRKDMAMQSYLSNVNYTYDDRYMAQVSFRRDGASNFGHNTKYGNFFSVSGGWNIHHEDFFKIKEINNLKLRASYGSVGNKPKEFYPQYTLYKVTNYNGKPGTLISQMGNPDLTWEKSYALGIGADISILNKVHLTLDYYKKNTTDLLYKVDIPSVSGLDKVWRNEGELENQGFEATVAVDIINTKDWYWNVDFNIGVNKNKIKKLYNKTGENPQMIVGDNSGIAGAAKKIYRPGLDSDTWYLKEWAGVNTTDGAPMWYKTDENGERVITSKYNEADEVPIGRYTPDFFGGFSTSARYKDFDLSATFSYSVGGQIYNYSRSEYDSDGAYTDRNQMKLHSGWSRWEQEGDVATHPKAIYNNGTNSNKSSSRFLETGTYLKMRNLTIGYNVPIKIKGISNLRAYMSGENLFTITHFSGVNPEIPPRYSWKEGQSSGAITGVSGSVYPQTRKFALGISITL